MLKRLSQYLALAALPLVATGATPPATYKIQLILKQGDTLIGTPNMLVAAGQTARTSATGANGARYDLSFSVLEPEQATYLVKLTVDGTSLDGKAFYATPGLLVKSGQPAALTIDPSDGLSLGMTVSPVSNDRGL